MAGKPAAANSANVVPPARQTANWLAERTFGQIMQERGDGRLDSEFAVELPRRDQVGLTRLMDDPPAAKGRAGLVNRPGNAFIQRSRAELPPRISNCGAAASGAAARCLRRTGLPVTRTGTGRPRPPPFVESCAKQRGACGEPSRGPARQYVLLQEDQRNAESRGGAPMGTLAYPPNPTTPATCSSRRNRFAAK